MDSRKESWQCEFSQNEIEQLDTSKLLFALEEGRAYLENVSEKTNRLSNKGLILIGFAAGLLGFLLSMILEAMCSPSNKSGSIIQNHWSTILLIGFCLCCLLPASYVLTIVVLSPKGYYPLGAKPENLLRKDVLDWSLNAIIIKQMKHYQERIEENVLQNDYISSCIKLCLWLVFFLPAGAVTIWFLTSGYRLPL